MPFHLHQHLHRRQSGHHHDDGSGGSNGGRKPLERLDVHDSDENAGNGQGASGTFVSIVYVTASQTFTGPVAGFTTIGVAASPSSQSAAAPAPSSNSPQVIVPPESSAAPASIAPSPALSLGAATTQTQSSTPTPAPSTSLLKSIKTHDDHTSTSSLSPEVVASQTTPASLTSASVSVAAAAAAAATTTPASTTVTNNDSSNSGLSAGAKAGIAIGVILCVLALAAGAFALYRSRKRRNEEAHAEAQNEKNPFADPGAAAAPTKRGMVQSQAPVLPPMGLAAAAPAHDVEKRAESPVNPFGPGAETIRETQSSAGPTAGPNVTDTDKIALGASAAGAAAGIATAAAAKRTSLPAPLKISRTQSPALVMPGAASPAASNFSEVSMATAASGAAPGPGSKMHRVQMDFTPTMDDELQIRAGEIVEVMHEYDDGWVSLSSRRHVILLTRIAVSVQDCPPQQRGRIPC